MPTSVTIGMATLVIVRRINVRRCLRFRRLSGRLGKQVLVLGPALVLATRCLNRLRDLVLILLLNRSGRMMVLMLVVLNWRRLRN